MTSEQKIHRLNVDLINLMMKKHGITYDDIMPNLDQDKNWIIEGKKWCDYYTLTKEEEKEFRKAAVDLIKKRLRMSKKHAEQEMSWWYLAYGLRVSDYHIEGEATNE